jgi:hypothetical protein
MPRRRPPGRAASARSIATFEKLQTRFGLDAVSTGKPDRDTRSWVAKRVDAQAKTLLAACQKCAWPVTYRRCLAAGKQPEAIGHCFRAEYDRGHTGESCDALLDHYMTMTATHLANLYEGHDARWVGEFESTHRESMKPFCIERGLLSAAGAACTRAATKSPSSWPAASQIETGRVADGEGQSARPTTATA